MRRVKDHFVLALIKGETPPGQVYVIGLKMPLDEITKVRARLPQDSHVGYSPSDQLEFRDPYQIVWQISVPESEFRTSGHRTNRWLEL